MIGISSFSIWLIVTLVWTYFDYDKSKGNIIFRYIFTFILFSIITGLLKQTIDYTNSIFFYSGWLITSSIIVSFFKNVKLINPFYLITFIIATLIKIFI